MKSDQKFGEHLTNAIMSFFWNFFVYFLFITPFHLWTNAVVRLSIQKQRGQLNISKINSPWPFLSFLKNFLFEFLFDGLIFISYIIGIVTSFLMLSNTGELSSIFFGIAAVYYAPLFLSIIRDFLQLLLLPIGKLLNWFRKPAQYLDLAFVNGFSFPAGTGNIMDEQKNQVFHQTAKEEPIISKTIDNEDL